MSIKNKAVQIFDVIWNLIKICVDFILSFFRRTEIVKFDNGREVSLRQQIAEGGFSVVFDARDVKHKKGKRYALKRVLCYDNAMVKKCREEAGVHRSFKHPNLLPLYATKFEKTEKYTKCYMLFPYIPNSLRAEITSRQLLDPPPAVPRPFSPRELLELFGGIVDAVATMHHRGLTHRDIKVENVLLDGNGKPVLMDFGSVGPAVVPIPTRQALLNVVDRASTDTTVSYRAPELFEGGARYGDDVADLDGRIDVWSLGCLLFAMMYGASPFEVEFRGDRIVIVECSQLRVLGNVPTPSEKSVFDGRYDKRMMQFVSLMLTRDRFLRPTIEEISKEVDGLLEAFGGSRKWRDKVAGDNAFEELIGDVV
mmetsp:Transcript_53787/g.64897  ORF Transcript_53787/g.64897 Transcript_53787/m.64897 type:complete len:367 (-) Transcript_53787:146-1246(-)|eukprot:CAMPEP_0172500520 /NCGR_PEP_ID=MMETSP1066-20121228/139553_1 /TAXON_ID=671091 /ORGANISM="Coscinodiscus wailesii, Strain CCMP2513" /LENGTH=366 /DNA_ID=CAMNT_0013274801 /DNA_START=189 /DNA_END=1289 /DNA_ORIENTATION=+